MPKKHIEANVAKALKIFVKFRFSMVRKHSKFLMDAFLPSLDSIDRQFQSASGEVGAILAEEAASINQLIDQTVPLILLRVYASYEAFVFRFIGMVTYNQSIKNEHDWKKAIKCLKDIDVIWSSIPGVYNVETMRLLINSYKHHDSRVHSFDLAKRLKTLKGEYIDWGSMDYKVYISSCEDVLNYLINIIELPAG
jgi:hypothetical protein